MCAEYRCMFFVCGRRIHRHSDEPVLHLGDRLLMEASDSPLPCAPVCKWVSADTVYRALSGQSTRN